MNNDQNGRADDTLLAALHQMIRDGKHTGAIRKLRSQLKHHPDDTAARYLLGVACFQSGKPEDALSAFEQVRAARPDIPELRTNLGAALAAVGRVEDAIHVLQEALDTRPHDQGALDNLVRAYLELGDRDAALTTSQKRIQTNPTDPEGYFLRGNVHLQADHLDRAGADFEKARDLDPDDPRYPFNHGFTCYMAGRERDAVRAFQTFCKIDRKNAALYTYQNARALFQRARSLALQNQRLRRGAPPNGIIGVSPQMEDLFEILDRVAPRDVTVLIRGESGTGKELFARALHDGSARSTGPFVPFNVAAVPDDLLESELFGHKKGAFTGATQDQPGLFETASGGTLFLDEIAEMSPRAQAKVLRALEERKIRRLGDRKEIAIDVRLVAATHQNLVQRVQDGTFRNDLYYRLKVVELFIPPLRDRMEDLPPLARHFLDQQAQRHGIPVHSIDPAALTRLNVYTWPGNIRELRNAIEHAVIMARGETLAENDFPPEIVPENRPEARRIALAQNSPKAEKARILKALEETHWHKGRAAERLDISRRHLYRLMDKYGIKE